MIQRIRNIKNDLQKGKILIIYGARQVGKTTLVKEFLSQTKLNYKMVTGDDLQLGVDLAECTINSTRNFVGDYDLIVIDEAQRIENIGLALKLMVDNYPDRYFIATGSSSFDLASKTSEPLTGRKNVLYLYTISQQELLIKRSRSDLKKELDNILVFGSYPEVVVAKDSESKEKAIREITNSYLLKDLLQFEGIKNAKIVLNILKMIALQIGSEVSTVEIAKSVGADYKTVIRYLNLLEKSFVIFSLSGFSRNLRKEITKMSKYYFHDLGIRNSLISNFNKISNRDDVGMLWENFLMIERMKRNSYLNFSTNYYFWRTYEQQEIDLVEENSGKLFGYEFKWSKGRAKKPKLWTDTYPEASFEEINQSNYLDFIT
jgi:uncharacterized protein